MGLQPTIVTANFDTIMPDLNSKRWYDVVISSQRITANREKQVDFIPYFKSGLSLLVQKGNPLHVRSLEDLCGQPIGVQDGTIEFDVAKDATKMCYETGKKDIRIIPENDQTQVIQLLANGYVTATFQDAPVTDYYYKSSPDLFEGVGTVTLIGPEGISIRKGDPSMFYAIQKAFNAVKADGIYDRLFRKWQLNPDQKI